MYQLKSIPEDFIVIEKNNENFDKTGSYLYCLLKKKDYNTTTAVELIAKSLGIPDKWIGFAGNKDKKAVTQQQISIKGRKTVANVRIKDIELIELGFKKEPLSIGELDGNRFEITVRNIQHLPQKKEKFPNLFGEQRFSTNNISIGRHLVKQQYKEALEEYLQVSEIDDVQQLIEKNNYIGAISKIPKRVLKLIVHSYQSYIWNETVKAIIAQNIEIEKVPIVGFGTPIPSKIKLIIEDLMKKESITERDFINRQLPFLSVEGDTRDLYTKLIDLQIGELEDDDLNQEKKKVKVAFGLNKGSYATVAIKYLFPEENEE